MGRGRTFLGYRLSDPSLAMPLPPARPRRALVSGADTPKFDRGIDVVGTHNSVVETTSSTQT
jgi:hypothetical protein